MLKRLREAALGRSLGDGKHWISDPNTDHFSNHTSAQELQGLVGSDRYL